MRQVSDLPELMTRKELAAFTGISVQTFARFAVEGEVNHGPRITKLGGAVRYRKAHVIEWLDESAE